MRLKHKVILGLVVAVDLAVIFGYGGNRGGGSPSSVASQSISPVSGLTGKTTHDAVEKAKIDSAKNTPPVAAPEPVDHSLAPAPAPATQLAPLTKGSSSSDDLPSGAEISGEAAGETTQPTPGAVKP